MAIALLGYVAILFRAKLKPMRPRLTRAIVVGSGVTRKPQGPNCWLQFPGDDSSHEAFILPTLGVPPRIRPSATGVELRIFE